MQDYIPGDKMAKSLPEEISPKHHVGLNWYNISDLTTPITAIVKNYRTAVAPFFAKEDIT